MTGVASAREALAGMQNIERESIGLIRGRGGQIDAKNFRWNHGQSMAEAPPVTVQMEVLAGSKRTNTDWARNQLEDSGSRIERFDVHQEILRIVEAFAPALLKPSNKSFEVK